MCYVYFFKTNDYDALNPHCKVEGVQQKLLINTLSGYVKKKVFLSETLFAQTIHPYMT